jgi:hypothetical protein
MLRKVQSGDFPSARLNHIPAALEAICLKAMAQHKDRYASPTAAADIESWLADEPVSAYREPVTIKLSGGRVIGQGGGVRGFSSQSWPGVHLIVLKQKNQQSSRRTGKSAKRHDARAEKLRAGNNARTAKRNRSGHSSTSTCPKSRWPNAFKTEKQA